MSIDSTVVAIEEALRADLQRFAEFKGEGNGALFSHRHTEGLHVFGCSYQLAAPLTEYRELILIVHVVSWDGDMISGDVLWSRSRADFPVVEDKLSVSGISDTSVAEFLRSWPRLCEAFRAALLRKGPRKKGPNQSPEPTTTAVTPPAAQEPRQP